MQFEPTLRHPIGRGHYAEVFRESASGGEVALKLLHERYAAVKPFVAFFDREAEALAAVGHPLFPRLVGRGSLPSRLGPRPWLALELREGTTPAVGRPMATQALIPLAFALLEGLSALHEVGLLHRDLHPRNLLVSETGGVTLLDLGNVWFLPHSHRDDRAAGEEPRLGSPETMAPEQFLGDAGAFGPATDLYGLGCTLLALLRGRWHFEERRFPLLEATHLDDAADWRALRGDPLERWVLGLVRRDPAARPATAAEAAALLRAVSR